MNHIYRLVWSDITRTWVAVAETAKGRGKRSSGTAGHSPKLHRAASLGGMTILAASLALIGAPAWALDMAALPIGGRVVAGSAAISQAANVLTVKQASQRAALDWQSFNIGAAATVNFVQPNSSAVALNRIVGNEASQIYGKLNANGQVFFTNPNGMLFARGAEVNVGGLLATTLRLSNEDFMAGNYRFTNPGAGSIRNEGLINALGSVALIGNSVQNAGSIFATTVTLAAGNTVAIDLTGDGLIRARVEDAALKASIENSGSIQGAQVTLTAGQAREALDRIVNNTGVVRATGLAMQGGEIVLEGGRVLNAGTLDASSAVSKGGTVHMLGSEVGVTGTGSIDASGATGGGSILLGGDYQGKNQNVRNASATYVGPQTTLKADAAQDGDGGKVIIWADDTTRAYGSISARGGAMGGNGGLIETSGKQALDIAGARVDASAPNGANGHWLLDPANVTITHGSTGALTAGLFDPLTTSSIGDTQINAALNGGTDVTIQTSAGTGGTGAIVVNGSADAGGAVAISNTTGLARTLTLTTAGTINIHSGASIAGSAGNTLNVTLNATGGNTIAGMINNSGGTTALTGATTLSGTISNGTITSAATLTSSSAILDGVTIGSNLTTSGDLWIRHGLTLGNGVTVNKGNTWYFDGYNTGEAAGTVHHLATLGASTVNNPGGGIHTYAANGQTLQIDSGVTVQGYGGMSSAGWAGNTIINAGTLTGNTAGQTFTINPNSFTNNGTLSATAGTVSVSPTTFTNSGIANVSGGTLNIYPTNWSNPGQINLNSGILNLGGLFTIADLTGAAHYTRSGGSVGLVSTLDNTGNTLDIGSAGLFGAGGLTAFSGTIKNGTIIDTDATPTLTSSSAILDGVTIGSNLTTSGDLWIRHGLTLGNGVTVNKGNTWYFDGYNTGEAAGTVHHLATLGASTVNNPGGGIHTYAANGQTLQIDSGVTVQGYGGMSSAGWAGNTIINAGTLTGNTAGQTFTINPNSFTNNGTLSATAGTVSVSPTTFTNSGIANVSGGTLNIYPTNWSNPGQINLNSGILNLGGLFTIADLTGAAHYTRSGGSVGLVSTLDNTGNTLDIGSAGLFGAGGLTAFSGTIKNGTIIDTDATPTLTSSSAILDGVTIGSNLTTSGDLWIRHGLTLGNGVTVNKGNTWYFDGYNTGEAAGTVHHLATLGASTVNNPGGGIHTYAANGQTLQIDSGVTVQGYGGMSSAGWAGNTIINAGTLIGNTAGQTFTINPNSFTNNGTLSATAGTVSVSPTTFTNSGIANVSGGTLNIYPTNWSNPGQINLNSGILNLGGLFTIADLTGAAHYTRSGGSVGLVSTLDNTGNTLDIGSAGLFGAGGLTAFSGTIKNGTIIDTDATPTLTSSSAILDGVTIGSNLTTSGDLWIRHGLTLGNGVTVNKGNTWYFDGYNTGEAAGTVHHLATLGASTVNNPGGGIHTYAANGQTLQIDSGVTVQGYGGMSSAGWAGNTIINAGTLIGNTAGQTFTINPNSFTNNGTLSATAGTVSVSPTTFTNSGIANVSGGTLNIYPTNWSNPGQINLNSGILNLGGLFTIADLTGAAHYTRSGGSVGLVSTLDNTGNTLDIGSAGLFGAGGLTAFSGTIKNGTIIDTDATPTLTSSSAILDGVTIGSNLTTSGDLWIRHGLTLGNGVTVNKGNTWYFDGYNTGEAAGTVHHLATLGASTVNNPGGGIHTYAANGQTLQIDSGVTVQGYGGMSSAGWAGNTIINAGTLTGNTAGQTFTINPNSFTNNGTLSATAGTVSVSPTTFTNSGIANVSGGTLNIYPTNWSNPGQINLNSGILNLGGLFTIADLTGAAHYTRSGGSVGLVSTLDNTGNTLDIGSAGLFGAGGLTAFSGTIKNGTIIDTDATPTLTSSSAILDGVTIGSNLTTSGDLWIRHGLTLGNGVTVNKGNTWYFDGYNTGEAAGTVHHLATLGASTVNNPGGGIHTYAANGQTLQIDSGVTVQGYGGMSSAGWAGNTIINAGTLTGNTAGQTFTINPNSFTNNGTMNVTTGTITVSPATFTQSGTINVAAGATFNRGASFTNTGTLTGSGTISVGAGNTLTNNGTIAPGIVGADTTGTLSITGNLVMGAGSNLNIDINSPLAGDYDKLSVSGTANLTNGTLNLSGGGSAGSYAIVNAVGGLSGIPFAAIIPGTFTQTPTYAATSLTLAVTANSNAAIFWDGGASTTNWADALNWSNDLVPTSASTLYIGSGAGTVFVTTAGQNANALTSDANFTLSAGDLTLASASTFRGITSISGGTLTGTGAITVATGGTLNWSGGIIDGTSATTLTTQTGSTSNVTGGTLGVNRTWNNSGTLNIAPATWTKTGTLNHTAGILNLNGAFTTANMFAFNRTAGSVVNLTGVLDNTSNTVNIGSAGLFGTGGLNSLSGTIKNGTLMSSDATSLYNNNAPSGTLDGVTISGNLSTGGNFWVSNGITLANAAVLNLGANGLYFNTTGLQSIATLGASTINSAGGGLYAGQGVAGQTLQINSGVTLQGYGVITQSQATPIVNAGTIIGNTAGQTFTINPTTFTNSGTLTAAAGTMNLSPTTFTNSGTTNVSGATLNIIPSNWTNPGQINVGNGVLNLGSTFTLADLTGAAHYSRTGGAVNLNTTLDLGGGTLDIGSAGLFGTGGLSSLSGTIKNGTLTDTDATPTLASNGAAILDGVTIGSNLNTSGDLWIRSGLTLGNGVTVNKGSSIWYFDGYLGGASLAASTVHHLATLGASTLNTAGGLIRMYAPNGQSLQIDSGVTLQGYGDLTQNWGGNTIINAGTIIGNTAGQTFTISPTTFTNNGTLSVTAGTMNLVPTTFTNSASGIANVSGGTLNITPTNWTNPGKINVNSGILNLGGLFTVADLAGAAHYGRTGGTVNLTGILDNTANTVNIGSAGLFGTGGLNSVSGTIKNGTLTDTDATPTLASNGAAILDGVTIGGNLSTSGDLWIRSGLTLGNGVTVNKGSSIWYFDGYLGGASLAASTVHHLATLGASTLNTAGGLIRMYAPNGQSLQIDSGVTLQGYGDLTQNWGGNTIINAGTIIGNTAGQTFTISPTTFTNNGTLSVTAGTMNLVPTTFTNSASGIANVSGGTLNITPTNWTNPGKINVNSGILNLGGLFTVADLAGAAHYGRTGGTVNLTGILDNTANTVNIGSAGLFGTGGLSSLSGTIKNGTLIDTDATPTLASNGAAILDGVTIGGNLNTSGDLWIRSGLTLGDGVTVNKGNNTWYFDGYLGGASQPASTVHHLATLGSSTLNNAGGVIRMYAPNGQSLQIDSGVTLQGYGDLTQNWGGNTIVNAGTLIGNTAGQTFTVSPSAFTNSGTLSVTAGTMNVSATTFTDSGTINVATGATFNRAAGFTNTGTLSGTGTIAVGTGASGLVNQGSINPGGTGATGMLAISGDLQLSTGSNLNMELGGIAAGLFDKLTVSGALSGNAGSFGGLTLSKTNGYTYVNVNGDTFPLLAAASGANTGTFAPFTLARTSLTPTYAATSFTLGAAPMVLTVNANALQSKIYGDVDPTLTYIASGFDTTTGDTAATALSGLLGRAAGTNVGAYAINQGALVSPLGYAISFTPGTNFGITPATLNLSADNQSRIYGEANPAFSYTPSGFKLTDTANVIATAPTLATTATAATGVGSAAVTVSGGNAGSNYTLAYVNGTLTIAQRPLTVTADAQSKTYGDADPALSYSIGATAAGVGLVNGDSLGGGLSRTIGETVAGGPYAIGLGSLAASSNYALAYTGANVAITPATLTLTADNQSRIYGEANPAFSYTPSGFKLSDSASVIATAPTLATTASAATGVGSAPITVSGGNAGGNYTLAYVNGTLSIAQRPVTVAATAQSKTYGDADPALSYSIGATAAGVGLVNGDSLGGGLSRTAGETVAGGPYAIGLGSLAASSNYALAYIGANLAITPATLTLAADNQSRVYGDANPAFTYTSAGFKLTDTANVIATAPALATVATATTDVGSAPITIAGGNAGSNYTLAYVDGTLAITPAPVTATATTTTPTTTTAATDTSGVTQTVASAIQQTLLASAQTAPPIAVAAPDVVATPEPIAVVNQINSLSPTAAGEPSTGSVPSAPAATGSEAKPKAEDKPAAKPAIQTVTVANTTVQKPAEQVVQPERPKGRMLVCRKG